jgi:hypothetical protein
MITKNYLTFDGDMLTFNGLSLYYPSLLSNTSNDAFFYPHVCAVYRSGGETDNEGNELLTGVYYGDCSYEVNSNGGMRLLGQSLQADAVVLIPDYDVEFKLNDRVEIEVENSRFISGTIENIEVVTDAGLEGTTLWIKNANG